jgi:hypothetical protein
MKKFTHTGILVSGERRPRGRKMKANFTETKMCWVSETGVKYKKSNGSAFGNLWAILRLDLDTIKEIKE